MLWNISGDIKKCLQLFTLQLFQRMVLLIRKQKNLLCRNQPMLNKMQVIKFIFRNPGITLTQII